MNLAIGCGHKCHAVHEAWHKLAHVLGSLFHRLEAAIAAYTIKDVLGGFVVESKSRLQTVEEANFRLGQLAIGYANF